MRSTHLCARTSPRAEWPFSPGKTVVRILVENKQAVGVELVDKGIETIMAGQVVLSAGNVLCPKRRKRVGLSQLRVRPLRLAKLERPVWPRSTR